MNFKNLPTSNHAAKRNPNVLHSILSQQRPIAPKNDSLTPTKSNDECNFHLEEKNKHFVCFSNIDVSTSITTIDQLVAHDG